MKLIKLYKNFKIDSICKKYGIKNYTINSDDTVDVDDNIDLSSKALTKLPLKFGNVTGYFACNFNKLTTLEGCPQSVGGDFDCGYNYLTTLEFSPKSVDGYFDCRNNKLTSLEGCSQSVGGSYFNFSNNLLKDLYGFPEFFDNDFYHIGNPVEEILDLFKTFRLGKVIDLINEYGVIQEDGNLVILDRLEEVFHMLNLEIPHHISGSEIKLDNYEVY